MKIYANLYGFPFCEFIIICSNSHKWQIQNKIFDEECTEKWQKEKNVKGLFASKNRRTKRNERIKWRRKNNCGNDMKRQRQRCWYCGTGIVWGDFVFKCLQWFIHTNLSIHGSYTHAYIHIYAWGVDVSAYSWLMAHDDDYYYYYSHY